MADAIIHLRVPAITKGRWIRASRAAGLRLTDWIVDAVEAQMKQQLANVSIPDGLSFGDLKLSRNADGSVSFDLAVIERICTVSDLPVALFLDAPEDNVSGLIVAWYEAHRQQGGAPDMVAEDLIAEVIAEEQAGQSHSLEPGRA